MNHFKDLGIATNKIFEGKSIDIEQVFNIPIVVLDFKIGPSKTKPGTECLTLHIELNQINHIIWTGSSVLMDDIQKVAKDQFPFMTTIVKVGKYFKFT